MAALRSPVIPRASEQDHHVSASLSQEKAAPASSPGLSLLKQGDLSASFSGESLSLVATFSPDPLKVSMTALLAQ